MSDLYLLEPTPTAPWAPFTASRPVCELRAGAWLIRERWEAIAEGPARMVFGHAPLDTFAEEGAPAVRSAAPVEGPAVIGRSDFAPSGVAIDTPKHSARLVHDGEVVGWWVAAGDRWELDANPEAEIELDGMVLHGAFDLVTALEHFLVADTADFVPDGGDPLPDGSVVIGDPADVVLLGALVEPGVTFDVRHGAVVLEHRAYVKAGARLEGPLYVGAGTQITGGAVTASAIGPHCRVHGEVQHTTFLGYANKAHDGFVGHSVVGRWVNLGAGTVTSNLKNTYGAIRLDVAGHAIETHRQYLGSLVGDHAKVAIGTLLNTGTVVGAGANIFGAVRPPRYVPPFAWGTEGAVMREDGFLTTATRVMPRRDVEVTDAVRAMLEAIYRAAVSAEATTP